MAELVTWEETGDGVGTITLNRPEKLNALSDQLLDELADAVLTASGDERIRVIVLTGAGDRAFCAGRDMKQGLGSTRPANAPPRPSPYSLILGCEKPTIAAINGYAFGGGILLALMCDLRYATSSATFRFPGAAYGLAVGTGVLAKLIGPSRAKDLIFSTRVIDSAEALSLGLLNGVVAGDVRPQVHEIAAGIAKNSAGALAASKRLIDATVAAADLMAAEGRENSGLRNDEQAERFRAAAERITGPSGRSAEPAAHA